ncbi:MAG: polysaccharide biosynthesis protein [Candidatus Staskawiczbacteria bacterium]|nr:polysaccharide biosynthesis protein [Candidatus Staskawiczbacteria bacterium]
MNLLKRTNITRAIFFITFDSVFIAFSVWLSFFIRFDGNIPNEYMSVILRMAVLAILFTVPIFYLQKLYSFSWAYVSTSEIVSLFKSATISFMLLAIAIYASYYFPYFHNFPRSTIFLSYILVFGLCSALRLSKKIYFQLKGFQSSLGQRTLIVGAGDAGEQVLRNIISTKSNSYLPIGFVDDNPIKKNVKIHGVSVLGKVSDIPKIVKEHNVKQLVIAIPSANNSLIKKAVELGRDAGLYKIKIAPPLSEIMKGEVSIRNFKDVDVQDLLGRSPVNLINKKEVEELIKGKNILITGSAGSIGSELSRQVSGFGPETLILVDQDETGIFNIEGEIKKNFPHLKLKAVVADITDEKIVNNLFLQFKPNVVFHAAAYKHVPIMEMQPYEAIKNNIFGTETLVKASLENDVEKFIFISTDKAVNPSSVMGATKRIGEIICQSYNQKNKTRFIAVRFGNVLDSRGSVIPIFRDQIRKRENITVTHPDMKRYFMLTSESCLLVLQAGAMGSGGEVFVLDMGEPVKIVDLARDMIRLSGYKPDKDIAIVFTGVRPGEKLFEELLTAEEGTNMTKNKKIFVAKPSSISFEKLSSNLGSLKKIIDSESKENIISFLKNITPYYK